MKLEFADVAFVLTVGYFLAIMLYVARKIPRRIENIEEFFSFPAFSSEAEAMNKLTRSFAATNASFATAFFGIFYLCMQNLAYGMCLVTGYLAGVLVLPLFLYPRMRQHVEAGLCYPDLIEKATKNRATGLLYSLIVCVSVALFYYTEIYGFTTQFLSSGTGISSPNALFMGFVLLFLATWYIVIGGYRSVILTDSVQATLIGVGYLGLVLFMGYAFRNMASVSQMVAMLKADISSTPVLLLLPLSVVGLGLSQIIYYDNWQRLVLYHRSLLASHGANAHIDMQALRRTHYRAIPFLVLAYALPICLATLAKASGTKDFAGVVQVFWQGGLVSQGIICLALVAFISALLSTVDTYVLAFVQVIHVRVVRLSLAQARKASVLLSLLVWPFIILHVDLGKWFTFLFYGINAMIGPVLVCTLNRQLRASVVSATVIGGIGVNLLAYLLVPAALDLVNVVVVIASVLGNLLASRGVAE